MFRNIKKIILTAAAVSFIAVACDGVETENTEIPADAGNPAVVELSSESVNEIGLKTEKAVYKPFAGAIIVPAKVIANQDNEAQVGSLVQGRVAKVLVRVGDYVKPGQILMYVESLEIGQIKAAYLKAKANLDFAKADYERHKSLFDQNIGSKQSFYEVQSEFEKALAEFNAEDQKISSVGLESNDLLLNTSDIQQNQNSGSLAVKSPIGGIVVERNVVIGQLVDGTTNAFKIINTSSVWIDGHVYEKDLSRISRYANAVFTSSAAPDEKYNGKLNYIGQTIDEKTRTITVRTEINNTSGRLKPQMFGELEIQTAQNSPTLLIPAEAVINIDDKSCVFIQIAESKFEKREITAGPVFGNDIEVLGGIKENEIVVVKGAFYLKSEIKKDEFQEEE